MRVWSVGHSGLRVLGVCGFNRLQDPPALNRPAIFRATLHRKPKP